MNIVVIGLNHKSAPVDVRERLAFDRSQILAALRSLKTRRPADEFVLLSTCNRVELYCVTAEDAASTTNDLAAFVADYHAVEQSQFDEHLYSYVDEDAVRHLLMVASSLDSMVVGEAEIVGQVKEGYRLACSAKTSGKITNRLFHAAFFTAKKIHTTTEVASGRVSVAGVAVELARQLFADISNARTVVIGAGEMGELVVRHLIQSGTRRIAVVNRSHERAVKIAERHGIQAGHWDELYDRIRGADIVISSVGGRAQVWNREEFQSCVGRRTKGSLLIIDLGVPRNFDPAINDLDNTYLYSIDELAAVAEENRRLREKDIAGSLEVIYEQAAEFFDWFKARDIGPLIGQMKDQFRQISENEVSRFFAACEHQQTCRPRMDAMVNRLVNKLTHCVIANVDLVAKEQSPAEAARFVHSLLQQARQIASESRDKTGQ
mgnify:CR=1 FL=1